MPDEPNELFEWDEAKSLRNYLRRGFDFRYALRIFEGNRYEQADLRRSYGETRIIAIGQVEDDVLQSYTRGEETTAGSFRLAWRAGENAMPIVRRTLKQIRKSGGGSVDLKRLRNTTDKDLRAQITSDPDAAPLITDFRNFRKVYHPPLPDVKAIRKKLKVSQAEFASRFGFSVRTVQQWEQGRAVPDRPARILLRVIERSPRAVERALYG